MMLPLDDWERELTATKQLYQATRLPPPGAERLVGEILEAYANADEEERRRVRELVPKYEFFFLRTLPPKRSHPIAELRLRLLLFSVKDQYPDFRDVFADMDEIVSLREELGVSDEDFKRLRREVALL